MVMDDAVYWFGVIARLLLFLVLIRLLLWGVVWMVEKVLGVRVGIGGWRVMGFDTFSLHSNDYELEIFKLFVSIKWFDSTCRRFFKVNIGRLHVDRAVFPPESNSKPLLSTPRTKPSMRKRFVFWFIRFVSKRVEVRVSSVEVYVHDEVNRDVDFLSVLLIKDSLSLLAQPMPDKMLAVSVEVESATVQLFMHTTEKCTSPEDHYSPLLELQCSTRAFLYLQPLASHGSPLASLQINTAPLSCTLLREGAFRYAVQHFNSYLLSSKPADRRYASIDSSSLEQQITKLPKVEIVLEDVSLHHQVEETKRVISSKLSRVSLQLHVTTSASHTDGLSAMIGVQDMSATDSLSREFLKLKRLRLNAKYGASKLSNVLKVESLHSTLREDEAVYWSKYFINSIKLSGGRQTRSAASLSTAPGKYVPDLLRKMMSSAVTTVEATDWSVSMRMDTPTLQSKEPLLQAVLASCAANLQWNECETSDTSATFIRASIRLEDSYLHVPGHHPSLSSDPSVFRQRPDDPTTLPSLRRHQWGHLLALGNLTLKIEKPTVTENKCTPDETDKIIQHSEEKKGVLSSSVVPSNGHRQGRGEGGGGGGGGGGGIGSFLGSGCSWWNIVSVLAQSCDGASITGEGSSVMVEWSTPTAATLLRTLQHLKEHYKLFGAIEAGKDDGDLHVASDEEQELVVARSTTEKEQESTADQGTTAFDTASVLQSLSKMALSFKFTDANAFFYDLIPDPPAVMLRLDAVSLSSPPPSPSPSLHVNLHGLLLDSLSCDPSSSSSFTCSPLASLPAGAGMGVVTTLDLRYQHHLKEVAVTVSRVESNWSPTHHRSLFHVITDVWNGIKTLTDVVRPEPHTKSAIAPRPHMTIGERMRRVISSLSLSLVVNLENAACHAAVDCSTNISLVLQTSHCQLRDQALVADTYELGVVFDKHKIVTMENLKAVFPREGGAGEAERKKTKNMELDSNPAVDLLTTRTKLIFPYGYKFAATIDKVLTVKKYLEQLHSGGSPTHHDGSPTDSGGSPTPSAPLFLPPDVHLQCGEVFFQLCEDPFEAKLRANYELMCDEYEQKLDRLNALDKKVEELKLKQGEFKLSAKKIQSLYDSLVVKDCQIYCQRAQELHSSPDACRDELFVFSLERIHLWFMFDPSMLGKERLVAHMKDMDDISPFPEGKYEFSTLWGAYVSGDTDKIQMQLRDYPHPLMQGTNWKASGRVVFAEQEAEDRETRAAVVELGHPWKNITVKRKLPPLKYYYDLEMDSATFVISYGPCLEPVLSQTAISFNLLTNPTIDPSRPLAYWDKFRLLFHGRIHLLTKAATILLPATVDPYNTVSFIELLLGNCHANLITNECLELEGSLQAYVHNATKYDDCELANFPHVKTSLSCRWVCGGRERHNHHAVRRCAPNKMPVLPDKQEHDSYSAFRSQNVDVDWSLHALPHKDTDPNPPSLLLFFSTLRWLQQYLVVLSSNVTRPIRKGSWWKVVRKRHRPPLLRHWRHLNINATFPKSVLTVWTSVAKQRGVECIIESGSASISYQIVLTPYTDGLVRRPSRSWNVVNFSGMAKDLIVFVERSVDKPSKSSDEAVKEEESIPDLLISNAHADDDEDIEEEGEEEGESQITRTLLGYTSELSYKRLEAECGKDSESMSEEESFTHQVSVVNTRVLLTSSNKQVVLGLYDAYKQAQMLKRYLSAEALRSVVEPILETQQSVEEGGGSGSSPEQSPGTPGSRPGGDRRSYRHSSSGNVMLDQLLKDLGNRLTVAEDTSTNKPPLKGVQLASEEDVLHKNWLITMSNIQVVLKGVESSGYVVASSNKAQVFGQEHQPVLKEGDLVCKKSWLACVNNLQYFSTFGSMFKGGRVPWLPLSIISSPSPKKSNTQGESASVPQDSESNLNTLLSQLGPAKTDNEEEIKGARVQSGSREAMVGGLVNCLLIPADKDRGRQELRGGFIQGASLQRIASRCQCNVIYVSYGGQAEPETCDSAILTPEKASPGLAESRSEAVDTLTVTYPTVKICTTSDQRALIMDILTNLLLHKEPRKKEVLDHRAHMQFVVQLSDIQDPRKPVLVQQNKVRRCLQTIRTLEHKIFVIQRQLEACTDVDAVELDQELSVLEDSLVAAKDDLSVATMNLRAMIRAFKESRLLPQPGHFSGAPEPVHRIEIWLDDAHWWLTQKDGQLEIADIKLINFSYNRVTFSDDSGEHRLELGSFLVNNLTPNTPPIYQQVLVPYDPKSRGLRVDRNICLRVYCRDKARVAGITVREHLEVNVVPLQVSLTARFYQTMQDFFFPKSEGDGPDPGPLETDHSLLFGVQPTHSFGTDPSDSPLMQRTASRRSSLSLAASASHASLQHAPHAGYSPPTSPGPKENRKGKHLSLSHLDTVKKMKERASHINTFIYVKIPQTTLCITYKGENWSYKDLQNQVMVMPTLEYNDRNWTWKDMLMEVKKDYKNAIIHQTLKSAIGMKESEEASGLSSPKLLRHGSDLLFVRNKSSKASKGKKLFGKLSREDSDSDKDSSPGSASPVYQPPLRDQETNLRRTYQKLTKLSQEAQK